jgi:hypothetical protein
VYLRADYTILCNSKDQELARTWAFFGIAFAGVGTPVLYLVILARQRRAAKKLARTDASYDMEAEGN